MKSITVQELKAKIDAKEDIQVIDVREADEVEICNFGAEHIPMADLAHAVDRIRKDVPVIIHCRSGKRSGNMIAFLEANHGLNNLYNLEGGILAWAKEIDHQMPTY